MILVDISNASELIAQKAGTFVERITPDGIDQTIVEEKVVQKMIESLAAEGLQGEIYVLNGLGVTESQIVLNEGFNIRTQTKF